jgi:hypothetical protein
MRQGKGDRRQVNWKRMTIFRARERGHSDRRVKNKDRKQETRKGGKN